MARDPIDNVIAEAEQSRGFMRLEPQPKLHGVAWSNRGMTTEKPLRRTKTSVATGLLLLIFLAIGAVLMYGIFFREPMAADERELFRLAAEGLIKQNLKSPATASFAPADEWTFANVENQTWQMRAWVDSQNSFGALLRNHFTVIVRQGVESWRLEYLKFDESDSKFGRYLMTPEEKRADDAQRGADAKACAAKQQASIATYQRQQKDRADADARKQAEEAAAWQKMREQLDDVRQRSAEIDAKRAAARDESAAKAAAARPEDRNQQLAIENARYRTWTSASGEFTIQAEIVSAGGNVVTLREPDGNHMKVELEKLSDGDRAFVDAWKRSRRR